MDRYLAAPPTGLAGDEFPENGSPAELKCEHPVDDSANQHGTAPNKGWSFARLVPIAGGRFPPDSGFLTSILLPVLHEPGNVEAGHPVLVGEQVDESLTRRSLPA